MAHVSYWEINDISLIYCDHVMIKIFLLSSALQSAQTSPGPEMIWAVDKVLLSWRAQLDHVGSAGPHTVLIDIEIQITDTRPCQGQADLCFLTAARESLLGRSWVRQRAAPTCVWRCLLVIIAPINFALESNLQVLLVYCESAKTWNLTI